MSLLKNTEKIQIKFANPIFKILCCQLFLERCHCIKKLHVYLRHRKADLSLVKLTHAHDLLSRAHEIRTRVNDLLSRANEIGSRAHDLVSHFRGSVVRVQTALAKKGCSDLGWGSASLCS